MVDLGKHKIILREDRPSLQLETLTSRKDVIGVELGVDLGCNALGIFKFMDIKKLYCVDPYIPFPSASGKAIRDMDYSIIERYEAKEVSLEVLKDYEDRIERIYKWSWDAVDDIPNDMDFIYIDGDHRFESAIRDIVTYFPKVKKGGVLCGHDFKSGTGQGVMDAVEEIFKGNFYHKKWDWWVYVE